MRIGEMSRRSGISVRMLRYYEGAGVLFPRRGASGYREYGAADLEAACRIRVLNAAGLTLADIRRVLPCIQGTGEVPCPEFRDGVRRRIADMDARIAALSEGRRLLAAYLEA